MSEKIKIMENNPDLNVLDEETEIVDEGTGKSDKPIIQTEQQTPSPKPDVNLNDQNEPDVLGKHPLDLKTNEESKDFDSCVRYSLESYVTANIETFNPHYKFDAEGESDTCSYSSSLEHEVSTGNESTEGFDSELSIKDKQRLKANKKRKLIEKRKSSISFICDRISQLHLATNSPQNKSSEDTGDKPEDDVYFPAVSITDEANSGEVVTDENLTEESDHFLPTATDHLEKLEEDTKTQILNLLTELTKNISSKEIHSLLSQGGSGDHARFKTTEIPPLEEGFVSCGDTDLANLTNPDHKCDNEEIPDNSVSKKEKLSPELSGDNSPEKLLQISLNASASELDKTVSCIDDVNLEDSVDSDDEPTATQNKAENLDQTIVGADASFSDIDQYTDISGSASDVPPATPPNQVKTSEKSTPEEHIPLVIDPKLFLETPDVYDDSTSNSPLNKNTEQDTVAYSPLKTTDSGATEDDNVLNFDLNSNASISPQNNNTEHIPICPPENKPENIPEESSVGDQDLPPKLSSISVMSEATEKLNQQQAEISDLKLKLNAAQQHNASLELQIRQNEEIVIKAQAEALKIEQNFKQELKVLKHKLNENSKIIEKDKIRELEEQLSEAKIREAKLSAELSQRAKDDVNYQKIMDQYEITLKSRLAETKNLQEQNDTIRTHLTNLELAFSDVHSKYEKTKAALQGIKANEDLLMSNLEIAQATNVQHEERYESLKAHARTQIEKSNKEIHDVKELHDIEISKLRAFIRRLEIKVGSLEVSLQQKTEECDQLSALCDEVTGKKV